MLRYTRCTPASVSRFAASAASIMSLMTTPVSSSASRRLGLKLCIFGSADLNRCTFAAETASAYSGAVSSCARYAMVSSGRFASMHTASMALSSPMCGSIHSGVSSR